MGWSETAEPHILQSAQVRLRVVYYICIPVLLMTLWMVDVNRASPWAKKKKKKEKKFNCSCFIDWSNHFIQNVDRVQFSPMFHYGHLKTQIVCHVFSFQHSNLSKNHDLMLFPLQLFLLRPCSAWFRHKKEKHGRTHPRLTSGQGIYVEVRGENSINCGKWKQDLACIYSRLFWDSHKICISTP